MRQPQPATRPIPECFCVFFKDQKRMGFYMPYQLALKLRSILKNSQMEFPLCDPETSSRLIKELEGGIIDAERYLGREETHNRSVSRMINEERLAIKEGQKS